MCDVFLSYNDADREVVRWVSEDLRGQGVDAWFAPDRIRPGESWPAAVNRALESSPVLAVFRGALGLSRFQEREVEAFLARAFLGARLIPVFLCEAPDDARFPSLLNSQQAADFRLSPALGVRDLYWGVTGDRKDEDFFERLLIGQWKGSGGRLRAAHSSLRKLTRMRGGH